MNDETTYDDIVVSDTQTCFACPTQWEGELTNGRYFYFRYRFGSAQLGVGDTHESALDDIFSYTGSGVVEELGGAWDGTLNVNEYRESFMRLIRRHPEEVNL